MRKYEYNGVTVQVPTGWHEIAVSTYDRMWTIKPKTARERAGVVAIACGVDLQVLIDWPAEIFELILKDVAFLFEDTPALPVNTVKVGDDTYVVAIDEKLTFGEYIDVDDVQKHSDAILSNVLGIVCRPAGEKYNPDNNTLRATMFGALSVSQIQGVLAFFLRSYQLLTQRTKLLGDLRAMADQLPPNTVALLRRGGIIKLSRIWPIIKYGFLMKLLRARLRKFSRFYYTNATNGLRN